MKSLIWISVVAWACQKKTDDVTPGDSGLDTGTGPPDCEEIYTWSTTGAPFVYTWCTGCHSPDLEKGDRQGAPPSVNLVEFEDVQAWAPVMSSLIWSTDPEVRMPPSGGIPEAELNHFQAWLDCGTPQ